MMQLEIINMQFDQIVLIKVLEVLCICLKNTDLIIKLHSFLIVLQSYSLTKFQTAYFSLILHVYGMCRITFSAGMILYLLTHHLLVEVYL